MADIAYASNAKESSPFSGTDSEIFSEVECTTEESDGCPSRSSNRDRG